MAFPTVQSTSSGNNNASTSHSVTMPSGLTSGDLILVVWCNHESFAPATVTPPAGYTKHQELSNNNELSAAIMSKVSDGTEGASQTFTLPSSETAAYVVYRITGHNSAVEATINNNGGLPGSPGEVMTWPVTALTPTWGAADTLWIVSLHNEGHNNAPGRTVSTNYQNLIRIPVTGALSNQAQVATGRRENNTATESPDNCTTVSNTRALTTLVGIEPAPSANSALSICNF